MNNNKRKISIVSFNNQELATLKEKVLHYIAGCNTFSFMDNNNYTYGPNRFELIAAVNPVHNLSLSDIENYNDWIFGHLNFEYKHSTLLDANTFPLEHFYIPASVIFIPHNTNELHVVSFDDPDSIIESILNTQVTEQPNHEAFKSANWSCAITKDTYIDTVNTIKEDIYYGKYYEINYCIQYFKENITLDPIQVFLQQNKINPAPYACCYRHGDNYLIATSPERFLFKSGDNIYCQPIKGTIDNLKDVTLNVHQQSTLLHNIKERAENVMIVDLTRNDLSKCCEVGSVNVPELFGIYEFPFVFQMISTIQGTLLKGISFSDIIRNTYPMGSMTGAPKEAVIKHIQQYESQKRNLYSGSVMYIDEHGNFDSNVVIRSLMYNAQSRYLQYYVGSAITIDSDPLQEWEELQWKAASMQSVLGK